MSAQPVPHLTPEEYLALERKAAFKSEYYRGTMCAMAGGSPDHALIITNLAGELRQAVKKRPCFVYTTELRLRVSPTGLYTYPDVMVVCGEPAFADDQKDTVLNPILIMEVLSESTEDYDRGRKFGHYRTLDSLEEYVLIAQSEPRVERFRRQAGRQWVLSEDAGLAAVLAIESLGCQIPFSEIYDKVQPAVSAPA